MNHKLQNNLHIIHWRVRDSYGCNFAVRAFDFKMTKDENKVTCRNCLKRYVEVLK